MNSMILRTNYMYGGIDPGVTNVFFTHGSIDPWHRMGIVTNLNHYSPAVFIPGRKTKCSFRARRNILHFISSFIDFFC